MSRFLYVFVCLIAFLNTPVSAHEDRSLFIENEEKETGAVFLKWRVPYTTDTNHAPLIA